MKHLIKIESTPNGVLGVRHTGLDQQYCEAGELVILKWQPDAKWGLQEAHYTDGDGNVVAINLTRVKVNGKDVVVFTMPNANITIGGTFKRFVAQDWTQGHIEAEAANIEPNVVTDFGEIDDTPVTFTLGESGGNGYDHYFIIFETGATAPTITWPTAIRSWVGGSAPVITANTHYEVSILDGIAAYIEALI